MPESARISHESQSLSLGDPGAANSGVPFYPHRTPIWCRRKEILYGTQAKTNPARTMARRASKICKLIGPAAGYYFWMVERIGSTDHTRFWCADAAKANGVTDRTIDNYNRRLKDTGFIQINLRKHKGKNTYAEYVLLPINDLIGDDGYAPQNRAKRLSPGPGEKAFAAKRAINKKQEEQRVLPVSSPHLERAAEQAEAGRAGASPATATAGFATRVGRDERDEHKKTILKFLSQNEKLILSLGFKPQNNQNLVQDILRFTKGDDQKWIHFQEEVWPLLIPKARASEWLSKRNQKTGFGWLFLPDKNDLENDPPQFNLQRFLFSKQYSSLYIPKTIYKPGSTVWVRDKRYQARILGFVDGSLARYWVVASHLTDPCEIEDNKYTANFTDLTDVPPTEAVVVASRGPSEALAVTTTPRAAPEAANASEATGDEDDETDPEILALRAELSDSK